MCNALLQRINDGLIKSVSDQYAKRIDLFPTLKDFILILLSMESAQRSQFTPSPKTILASSWCELFFFLRDYTLLHPQLMAQTSDLALYFVCGYNGNQTFSSPKPRGEWQFDLDFTVLTLLHHFCTSYGWVRSVQ